jgi:hypothetical protein
MEKACSVGISFVDSNRPKIAAFELFRVEVGTRGLLSQLLFERGVLGLLKVSFGTRNKATHFLFFVGTRVTGSAPRRKS